MLKNVFFTVAFSFAVAAVFVLAVSVLNPPADGLVFAPDGSVLRCEVASTPQERAVGLMNRTSLCESCCMLFVFEETGRHYFWMKDTLIPLDLIFLNEGFAVVGVKQNFQPCTQEPCPVYSPDREAKYVVEVNAGKAAEKGIAEGGLLKVSLRHGH